MNLRMKGWFNSRPIRSSRWKREKKLGSLSYSKWGTFTATGRLPFCVSSAFRSEDEGMVQLQADPLLALEAGKEVGVALILQVGHFHGHGPVAVLRVLGLPI